MAKTSKPGTGQPQSRQRQRIEALAAELFAKKGYNGVGIAELGDTVGLGRGSLYYHIGSKENLLHGISTKYMTKLIADGAGVAATHKDPEARIRALSRNLMETIGRHLAELTVCFREINSLTGPRRAEVARLHAQYQRIWEQAVEDGIWYGVFRQVDPIAVKGLLGMYFYSFLWLDPEGRKTPAEIGDIFADLVLSGLRNPANPMNS